MQTYLFTYSLSLLLINLFTTFYFQPYLLTYLIYKDTLNQSRTKKELI